MSESIKVFTAKACFAPLEETAKLYEQKKGIHVETLVCGRACAKGASKDTQHGHEIILGQPETFLLEISEIPGLDIAISGAEYLFDDGEDLNVIIGATRRGLGLRESCILVKPGNPKRFRGLEDLAQPGVRIGVSIIDCLKGLWEDIAGRARMVERIRRNITTHLTGCIAITEAVADGRIDAGFGWSTFKALSENTIDILALPPELKIYRSTCAAVMKQSTKREASEDFIAFLASAEGKAVYRKHGWITEPV
jgi:accessory colonization factor AcfC